MKRVLIFAIFTILLGSLIGFAIADNLNTGNETPTPKLYTANTTIVGASCGTVTPGYQNECCLNKGYKAWDKEDWECTNDTKSNDNNETETDDDNETDDEGVICAMDVKVCPDGTQVGRTGEDCEFKCPKQYNISKEKVCCKISESDIEEDSNQTKIDVEYEITDKKECSLEGTSLEKSKEIVNNSYCIEQIKEDREDFLKNKWEIMQEKNRIKHEYKNQSECPENCSCSGSTIRCEFENGTRILTITAGESGNVIVQVKNINASTNVTLYKADGKVYGVFDNNETHQIILPDEVKERIKEMEKDRKGRITNLTDENITLNETGYYYVEGKKHARLFWFVPVKEKVEFTVNSETGEIIKTKTKWWGFLARDVKD